MPSWEFRVVLLIILVLIVLARRFGWIKKLKQHQRDKAEKLQKQHELDARKEQRKTAQEKVLQRKKMTADLLRRVAPDLQQKSTRVAGQELWYLEGRPQASEQTILLLHGFAGEKEDWAGVASHLMQAGWRVIAPDLPGFGQNAKDADVPYDVTAQAKRIRAFVKSLGLKQLHIGGCSMGGSIAAACAYAMSEETQSLTLIEPFGVGVPYPSELDELLKQDRNPMVIAVPTAYDNLLGFLCAEPPELPPALKQYWADQAAENRFFYLKVWKEIRHGERANILDLLLPEVQLRTLVILGAESRVVHGSVADMIRNLMPERVQAVVMEGCGHFPMVERPEETAAHLLGFLTSKAGGEVATAPGQQ